MTMDDEKDTLPPPSSKTETKELIDTPFPPAELPEDVLRRLEEAGVIQPSSRAASTSESNGGVSDQEPTRPLPSSDRPSTPKPKGPPGGQPYSFVAKSPAAVKAQSEPRAQNGHKSPPPPPPPKSPPPPPPKKAEPIPESFREKIQPLVPSMQKLLKFMSGGVILPGSVSFEHVKMNEDGLVYIGTLDVGQYLEGKDGNGSSIRFYFSRLNMADAIPDIVKKRFPVSESILAINRAGGCARICKIRGGLAVALHRGQVLIEHPRRGPKTRGCLYHTTTTRMGMGMKRRMKRTRVSVPTTMRGRSRLTSSDTGGW
jgi:hypothetical protein